MKRQMYIFFKYAPLDIILCLLEIILYLCRRFERGAVKAEIRPVEPDADNAAVGSFTTFLFPLSVCLIY